MIFYNGKIVTPSSVLEGHALRVDGSVITTIAPLGDRASWSHEEEVDLGGCYLVPGFIDLHVHGGDGADFMDATPTAWRTVRQAHLRHGTTSLTPTSTVANHDQMLQFLERGSSAKYDDQPGSKVLGTHFYGPYFAPLARGCHPKNGLTMPLESDYGPYLEWSNSICSATIAPELPGAEPFTRACRSRNIRCNIGHSHATFAQVEDAIAWGVQHVDHLFCAMSDRAFLRRLQTFPMRGGVMEATLFFDSLTTEVIADGKHLSPELLRLAFKIKGPGQLALVTDSSRALDQPDGTYIFGPEEGGEKILKKDGVGLTEDGLALASSVLGMDDMLKTMINAIPEATIPEIVRMATLTPARILGVDHIIGSIQTGKCADMVMLDQNWNVIKVFQSGKQVASAARKCAGS